jgi:transposase
MTLYIIGIDISKLTFDLCLLRGNGKLKHKVFPNTAAGFAQLSAWLQKQKIERAHLCMEATGTYGETLATSLFDSGHMVSVVNPAIIKAYAQSHLSRYPRPTK